MSCGGGGFTKNLAMVSDYVIDWFLKYMLYVSFYTFFGILPDMGPKLGALKVKKITILAKSKTQIATI